MSEVAFYDTCVFILSLNESHRECLACQALLDVALIKWVIAFGEISKSESTISEFLDSFEVTCAQNGVNVISVSSRQADKFAKSIQGLKKKLRLLGFGGRDWKQLSGAASVKATTLITDDRDFWDPASKRGHTHPQDGPVRRIIKAECKIDVELPSTGATKWNILRS